MLADLQVARPSADRGHRQKPPWSGRGAGSTSSWRALFDASRTADETAGKPHPLMLHELMAEFGVPPERTLMIGDTTHDLQMALNAGCASVGVSYGAHEPEAFDDAEARFLWRTPWRSCMTGCVGNA